MVRPGKSQDDFFLARRKVPNVASQLALFARERIHLATGYTGMLEFIEPGVKSMRFVTDKL